MERAYLSGKGHDHGFLVANHVEMRWLDYPYGPYPATGPGRGHNSLSCRESGLDWRPGRVYFLTLLEPLAGTTGLWPFPLVADLISEVGDAPVIPRRLTGKLWFIFTQMLSEADHTRSPEEILNSAWRYAGQLQKLFGPWYGQGPPTPGIPRY